MARLGRAGSNPARRALILSSVWDLDYRRFKWPHQPLTFQFSFWDSVMSWSSGATSWPSYLSILFLRFPRGLSGHGPQHASPLSIWDSDNVKAAGDLDFLIPFNSLFEIHADNRCHRRWHGYRLSILFLRFLTFGTKLKPKNPPYPPFNSLFEIRANRHRDPGHERHISFNSLFEIPRSLGARPANTPSQGRLSILFLRFIRGGRGGSWG